MLGFRQGSRMAPLLIGLLTGCLCNSTALAQVLDQKLWGTGTVTAIAKAGNTLYVAGSLGEAGPNVGGGITLSAITGEPVTPYLKVTGYVGSVLPDGRGGWFIGGDFTAVGGSPRSSLAHILHDGSLDPWAPSQDAHSISRMVLSGATLYVAGNFNFMDGQRRVRLAAFDAITGDLLSWNPSPSGVITPYTGPAILGLAARNDTVFVCGNFTELGGKSRVGLAALDGRTGQTLDWYPGPANNEVSALALHGNTLYLGGYFTSLAGQARNRAAAVDVATSAVLPWNPDVTGPDDPYGNTPRVMAIATKGSAVILGGLFSSAGGQLRVALAAVDADTGGAMPWNPAPAHTYSYPPPSVSSLAVQGDTIYVGGNFEVIGGADRISLASVDASTGSATSWSPRPNFDHDVVALAVSGGVVYVGGTFTTMGPWQARGCFAAFDLATGALKNWDPKDNGTVARAMIVSGGKVYVAGDFTFIGGQPRSGIAALDTLTGAALPWNPGADNWIYTMIQGDSSLYVGGAFLIIGGQPRRFAAALDTATGLSTAWNPDPDDYVTALARRGETVYVGGLFQHVAGTPRSYLAAVDASTAKLKPWRADCDSYIDALAVNDSAVFAGGQYISTVNGQPRTDLFAVDAATGDVKPWDAHLSGSVATPTPAVKALELFGHTLYVGGDFYSLGGQVRPCLAALDDSTGLATSWAPRADLTVWSLAICGETLYAGGFFGAVDLLPCQGLAALSIPTDPVIAPPTFALAQNFPNPARAATTVRFTLPSAAVTTLTLFDIQGRRVAMPLCRAELKPGPHDVGLPLGGLTPGIYLYRLEADGKISSRKMLVVH